MCTALLAIMDVWQTLCRLTHKKIRDPAVKGLVAFGRWYTATDFFLVSPFAFSELLACAATPLCTGQSLELSLLCLHDTLSGLRAKASHEGLCMTGSVFMGACSQVLELIASAMVFAPQQYLASYMHMMPRSTQVPLLDGPYDKQRAIKAVDEQMRRLDTQRAGEARSACFKARSNYSLACCRCVNQRHAQI